MRTPWLAFATLLIVGTAPAIAQNQRGQPQPAAKPAPYKVVAVTPPQAINDPAFEALRKQMGEAAQRKDRAALANSLLAKDSSGTAKTVTEPTSANPASTISRPRSG
jgi:hypothetical protein